MTDLDAIVAAHSADVWRTAWRLLNHREDSLDCHQQTFLEAARLARSAQVGHWRALLVRIATRRAVDRLRERYWRNENHDNSQHLDAVPAADQPPDAQAQDAELREQVRRAPAHLPAPQAEAFWLRHIEQLSPGEVADQLHIEPGHARVLVHRAAAALRELLGPAYGPATDREKMP